MKFLSLAALLISGPALAQPVINNSPDSIPERCEVVYSKKFPKIAPLASQYETLGLPSHFPSASKRDFMFDNGYEYVYRLAVCIGPHYMSTAFHNSKEEANRWLDELSEYLNSKFNRDVGIRLEFIRDERLLLTEYPEGITFDTFKDFNGTKIIDNILGSKNYELGILIRPSSGSLSGRAQLGGVDGNTTKGSSMASMKLSTIAHELGHMFGARHAHHKDDGTCAEPGNGQSLMSYGSNRIFFSTASAAEMRNHIRNSNYYKSNSRVPEQLEIVNAQSDLTSFPYVVEAKNAKPDLDKSLIRKEYFITEGTYFQFYLPEKKLKEEHLLYAAQGYDVALYGFETNPFQPTYPATENSNIMFQPHFNRSTGQNENFQPRPEKYTDNFSKGRYTFLLSANNKGRYDVVTAKLNIVEGASFKIKSNIGMDQYFGRPLNLVWEPCTQLYGKDSKVRILLSDDFGKTYKYVLADNVPNTGTWEGFWPYLNIGRTPFEDFGNDVRGGVIKIEVKGEAAYAVSHIYPGSYQGDRFINDGGFLLGDQNSYVLFEKAPQCYLEVNSEQEVPPMEKLTAYFKRNTAKRWTVEGKEEKIGNYIRRVWKTDSNGSPYAYTQVIMIKNGAVDMQQDVRLRNRAEALRPMANDLYQHKGELGYPQVALPEFVTFETLYSKVFDNDGYMLKTVAEKDIDALEKSMNQLTQIKDNEVSLPKSRHYYIIRNYQDIFGRDRYWYIKQNPNPNHQSSEPKDYGDHFVALQNEATQWRCVVREDSIYEFTANKRMLSLPPLTIAKEALKFDRGFTWGAFTMLNERRHDCTLSQNGKTFASNTNYMLDPQGYRINGSGIVSSDFQVIPVDFIEAQKTADGDLCNILTDKNHITIDDAYQNLYAPKAISAQQITYTRTLDENWQPLFVPFSLSYESWKDQCQVARIDQLKWEDSDRDGKMDRVYMELVEVKSGALQPNHPYLIKALNRGTVSLTVNGTAFGPTVEKTAQYSSKDLNAQVKGNYGVINADKLASTYVLSNGRLQKAAGTSLPSMRWALEATSASGNMPATIELRMKQEDAVGTLSIATPEGYGTVYTEYSYVMPEGVTGYTVVGTKADSKLEIKPVFSAGETVPEHTALLIKGEPREYPLFAPKNIETVEAAKTAGNLLMGTVGQSMTVAPDKENADGYYFYKMYYSDKNPSHTRKLGFYWGNVNGTAFVNGAGKAYLAIPVSQGNALYGFTFIEDGTTGIDTPAMESRELTVYTIAGMRLYPKSISDLPAGIYIINGRKQIIK